MYFCTKIVYYIILVNFKMTLPKKQIHILESADRLFMKFGVRKVTIDEVCNEAKVSKMTFYKYFNNKKHLVKSMLKELMEENSHRYEMIMTGEEKFGNKIVKLIEMKSSFTEPFSKDFMKDIYSDPDLHQMLNLHINEFYKRIKNDFLEAQNQNELRKDIHLDTAFYLLTRIQDIFTDDTMLSEFDNVSEVLSEWIKIILYGIVNREK